MNLKIIKYETKRIICSKLFVITFILTGMYSLLNLYTKIMQGVSGTAPFSPWSYSMFLCNINTMLLFILMLSCTGLFSKKEQHVRAITSCTALSQKKYLTSKIMALFISYFMILVCCIIISLVFYSFIFHYFAFQNFIIPIIIILIPTFVFVLGASMFLGSKSETLLYIWIFIVLLWSMTSFSSTPFLDVFAKGYVTFMPTILPVDALGEPIFKLSFAFIMSRLVITLVGVLLFHASFHKLSSHS